MSSVLHIGFSTLYFYHSSNLSLGQNLSKSNPILTLFAILRHDIGAILDAWKECLYESAELMNAYEYNDDDDDYPVDEAYEFGEEEGMDDYDIVVDGNNVDNDDVDEDEERDEEEADYGDIDIIMDSPSPY